MAEGRKGALSGKQRRFLFARGILKHTGKGKDGKVAYDKGASSNAAPSREARIAAGKAIASKVDPGMVTLAKRLKGVKPGGIKGATGSTPAAGAPRASYSSEQRAGLLQARVALQREINAPTRAARVAAGKRIAAKVDAGEIALAKRVKGLTGGDVQRLRSRDTALKPARENRPDAVYSPAQRARLRGARAALKRAAAR
jgi:hypothetical protein